MLSKNRPGITPRPSREGRPDFQSEIWADRVGMSASDLLAARRGLEMRDPAGIFRPYRSAEREGGESPFSFSTARGGFRLTCDALTRHMEGHVETFIRRGGRAARGA